MPYAVADAGWTGYGQIVDLSVNARGRVTLELAVTENETECRNKRMFYHDINQKGSGYLFELLSRAAVSNKAVRVYQTSVCDVNNYSRIYAVSVQP